MVEPERTSMPLRRREPALRGRRSTAKVLVAAVSGLLAVFGLVFVIYVLGLDHQTDAPCPGGSHAVHPTVIHFAPTVIEHQNWVGIPPDEVLSGQVIFICTDGRAIGRAVMDEEDEASTIVALDIPTRWVDAAWLSGTLEEYREPDRWLVVFPPFDES